MKNSLLIIAFGLISILAAGQTTVELYSGMDGSFISDDGTEINFWGYGYLADDFMTLPAPLLEFEVGEEVELYFENPSPEAHTIHLHGLDVNQANDGVPTTSFQVQTGGSATYNFTATHPGTYIYHCHVTTTLHLTMGMYGLIVVRHSGDQLYDNSPEFQREYNYLFSDLERETNANPAMAFPFHTIHPDYFMVNGKSGGQISEDPSLAIEYGDTETVALRLGNIGYSKVVVSFEDEHQAVIHMSDGRVIPEPFSTNELEIYPGERFIALIQPLNETEQPIDVAYYSMLDNELEHENSIPLIPGELSIEKEEAPFDFQLYPNPARESLTLQTPQARFFQLMDLKGKVVGAFDCRAGLHIINVDKYGSGMYLLMESSSGTSKRVMIENE